MHYYERPGGHWQVEGPVSQGRGGSTPPPTGVWPTWFCPLHWGWFVVSAACWRSISPDISLEFVCVDDVGDADRRRGVAEFEVDAQVEFLRRQARKPNID